MRLEPETYVCPTHTQNDLTPSVRAQLEEDPPPLVTYRPGAARRFSLFVWCPGTGPDSRHEQACAGEFTP